MNEIFAELLELARIDSQLVKCRKRVLAGPRDIALKETAEQTARKAMEAIRDEVRGHALDGDRHALEAHTAAAELAQVQQRLRVVKNNAEYSHLNERLQDLRETIDREESAVLQSMETLDRLRERERERAAALDAARADLEKTKADVALEAERIKVRQRDLKFKRDFQLQRVAETRADALEVYNAALQRTRGDALAVLADQVCQACFRQQSPGVLNALVLGVDLKAMVCPGCGRILHLAKGDDGLGASDDDDA